MLGAPSAPAAASAQRRDWVTSTGAPASSSMKASRSARIVRVERQIGAAGLEDAEQPHDHLERALQAQPHHRLRPDPERAQMMRQPVGARVELAIAQRARPRTPPRSPPGVARSLRREQLRQASQRGSACAVAFQPRRMRLRAPPAPECRAARSHAPASATAASSSRTSRAASASTLARSNRSVAYSITPQIPAGAPSAARSSPRLTDRSNLALAVATGSNARRQPGQLEAPPPRCSGTPASPGTADGATASAPG